MRTGQTAVTAGASPVPLRFAAIQGARIRTLTAAVATRLGLDRRGVLGEDMVADVVVFDPERIIDRATYRDPHQLSEGVLHVWVNGEAVVRDGEHTGALPGRVLRGAGYSQRGSVGANPE